MCRKAIWGRYTVTLDLFYGGSSIVTGPPEVTNVLLYLPIAGFGGDAICQMSVTNNPTGWTITSETLNDIVTSNYWFIDEGGNIYCNNPSALTINDMAVINVQASNSLGSGDGVCTIGVIA
jgi:hypothetical protein